MTTPAAFPFSSAAQLDRELPTRPPRFRFRGRTAADWAAWRQQLLPALVEIMGPWPGRDGDLRMQVIAEQEFPEYIQRTIRYESRPGVSVPAYLLLPRDIKAAAPAVLCVHGHVPGGKQSVVTGGHEYGVAYGADLARRGVVTLCPDNAGMGERAHADGDCDLLWRRLNFLGQDLTGYRVHDLRRGIDCLQQRPEVDPRQIGIAGLSGGCWLAQVTAALDDRIAAAVLSGYFTTFAQTSWVGHCVCHHPKGIGLVCEMPDIAGLIAPRPIFVEWGRQDTGRPVHPAFALARKIYAAAGAPDRIRLHEFNGPHRFCGENSLPWLVGMLRELSPGR